MGVCAHAHVYAVCTYICVCMHTFCGEWVSAIFLNSQAMSGSPLASLLSVDPAPHRVPRQQLHSRPACSPSGLLTSLPWGPRGSA